MLARTILIGSIACTLLTVGAACAANDSLEEARDTAEVFVYGRESKNEALLEELSNPEAYEEMARARSRDDAPLNENVRVRDVRIEEVDGDRAVARATYSQKHSAETRDAEVHLQRVDGKWQVTTPPKPAE